MPKNYYHYRISAVLEFCLIIFYNKMPPGLAFPVYIILILAGLLLLVKNSGEKPNKTVLWLILPLLFFLLWFRSGELLLAF